MKTRLRRRRASAILTVARRGGEKDADRVEANRRDETANNNNNAPNRIIVRDNVNPVHRRRSDSGSFRCCFTVRSAGTTISRGDLAAERRSRNIYRVIILSLPERRTRTPTTARRHAISF